MSVNGSFLDKNGLTYLWSKLKILINSKASTSDIYGIGSEIEENTNLNNIVTIGKYYSSSSTRSATLYNSPVDDSGFELTVITPYGANVLQILQPVTTIGAGIIFQRIKQSNSWGSWYRIADGYSLGTSITANGDLNNYTSTGRYYAGQSISNSITNKPVSVAMGFELTVEYNSASSRIIQTITYNSSNTAILGNVYKRWYTYDGWSAWYVYEGTPITSS